MAAPPSTLTPEDCTGDKLFRNEHGLVLYNHGPSTIVPHTKRMEIIDPVVCEVSGITIGWKPTGFIYHVSNAKFERMKCG